MRLLFIGDVVGEPGCRALHALLPGLRQQLGADAVVVNGENAHQGRGITPAQAEAMLVAGVDVITGGNHIWRLAETEAYLRREPRLLRPANYPRAPGGGSLRVHLPGGVSLGVVHVEGRAFMRSLDCPFAACDRELSRLGRCDATLVDVHAEASAEKQALAFHLDGRVSAVLGTHTHVPTADERILPRGTAFQTDVGMTGPYRSVIGMEAEAACTRLMSQRPVAHRVASEDVALCGALVEVNPHSGLARRIVRVRRPWPA